MFEGVDFMSEKPDADKNISLLEKAVLTGTNLWSANMFSTTVEIFYLVFLGLPYRSHSGKILSCILVLYFYWRFFSLFPF